MSTLQQLKREGSIALWHDYRLGHALDQSGNGNDGILVNDPVFTRNGAVFDFLGDQAIQVIDSASLQLTTFAIAALFFPERIQQSSSVPQLCRKQDASGLEWGVRLRDSVGILRVFLDAATVSYWNITRKFDGIKHLGLNVQSNTAATNCFLDGVFDVAGSLPAPEITLHGSDLFIGNIYTSGRGVGRTLSCFLIFNRLLTETEHANVYGELIEGRL